MGIGVGKWVHMINIFHDEVGDWEVWTDVEGGGPRDGRCLGVGRTEKEAVADAMTELGAELAQLRLTFDTL